MNISLAGAWTHENETWRNLWRSKPERTARVELELTDFSHSLIEFHWLKIHFKFQVTAVWSGMTGRIERVTGGTP